MNKLPIIKRAGRNNINFKDQHFNFLGIFFTLYLGFIFLIFIVLFLRLFQLTVVKGSYYKRLSEQNRIKELVIEPKRGKIIDRKGYIVAENTASDIKNNHDRLTSLRIYNEGEAVAPLIGYRQIADKNDLNEDNCLNKLKPGDKIGKKGVEKLFECDLRGIAGKKLIEVDAGNQYLKTLAVETPTDGIIIQLALDLQLQKKAYELIKDKRGAVVALRPQTGEILLLASSPYFNPQIFEDQNSDVINQYLKDPSKPLFNRAAQGTYPPGSTFKPFISVAALEEKKLDENTQFEDTGIITAGTRTFATWNYTDKGHTEGSLNIVQALKRSNDIFFYKTGELLGPDLIKKWAQKFGFGSKTQVMLDEEEGVLPSSFWKEETIHDQWYLGDTYNLSIGQGYLLVTPLQLARATAVFANNGILCKPELLKNVGKGRDLSRQNQPNCQKLPISQKTLDLVRTGMYDACHTGGTGWPFFDFAIQDPTVKITTNSANLKKIDVACKTGTAESNAESKIPHAWFTIFAPFKNPEIVIAILLEEAGQGSDVAAPIAKEILKTYFERKE